MIIHIFIAPKHGAPMQSVARVEAVEDAGLRGDRYTARQVTFIEHPAERSLRQALFEGVELCEPCSLFARRTHREILEFFPQRAGLRARVISAGEIRVGESIEKL